MRSVEISYVVVRFVAVSRGGLGVLGRDALCFGTLRQGQAVKAGQLSAGRGEVRLVKAVEIWCDAFGRGTFGSGEAVGVRLG